MKIIGNDIFSLNGYNSPKNAKAYDTDATHSPIYLGPATHSVATWGNNSVQLDGTTDYIKVPNTTLVSLSGNSGASAPNVDATFAMWFKADPATQNVGLFTKGLDADSDVEYRMFLTSNKFYFDVHTDIANNYRRLTSDAITPTTGWQHICFTYKAGQEYPCAMYRNGEPLAIGSVGSGGTYTGPNYETGSDLWIGAMEHTGSYDLAGNIAHVMIWHGAALNSTEVKYIYGSFGSTYVHINPMINTSMYNSAEYLGIPCQASEDWVHGGVTYTGPPNRCQPTGVSLRPGGVLMGNAAIENNDSPIT